LGRVLVRRRPIDALGGGYFHRHPALHFVEHARRNQILHLRRMVRSDEVARLDACLPWQAQGREGQQSNAPGDDCFAKPHYPQLHSNLHKSPEMFLPLARVKITRWREFYTSASGCPAIRTARCSLSTDLIANQIYLLRSAWHGYARDGFFGAASHIALSRRMGRPLAWRTLGPSKIAPG